MEEIEVPLEKVSEDLHEAAHHAQGEKEKWISRAALGSALLAVFAALSSLLAGYYVNEAFIDQIKASDQWAYYQAKGIKMNLAQTKLDLFTAQKIKVPEDLPKKIEEYKSEQSEIAKEATEKEHHSERLLAKHEHLARSVTFFQVAIAVAAISVLAKRKKLFTGSMGFGLIGLVLLILGML